MAKKLNFCIGEKNYDAGIIKVDRDKVYGFVEEQVLDINGNFCLTANLLDDGQTLILSGATALKTVTQDKREVDKSAVKTVYQDGTDAVLIQSSYDSKIELMNAEMDDLFNLEVNTVYQLVWEDEFTKNDILKDLEGDKLFRFVFNYRADYEGADAILMSAQNNVFILTGKSKEFTFLENKTVAPIIDAESPEQEEELDFGML
jgi:hypothetical protein